MNNPKKVFTIAYFFPPEPSSGSLRNIKLLKNLAPNRYHLTVLTINKNLADPEGVGELLLNQIPPEVEVERTYCQYPQAILIKFERKLKSLLRIRSKSQHSNSIPQSQPKADTAAANKPSIKSKIRGFVNTPDKMNGWFPFALVRSISLFRKGEYDLIYAIGKPWTGLLVATILKKIFKVKLVIDYMDPWTTNPVDEPRPKILDWLNGSLERYVVKNADFVIANTEELSNNLQEVWGLPPRKLDVITCGFDRADFKDTFSNKQDRNDKFTITHIGTFYWIRTPKSFLEAIFSLLERGLLKADQLRINFIGSLEIEEPELLAMIEELDALGVLKQEQWVPHEEAIRYLFQSDLLLLIQPQTRIQIPAKLYEYICTRKPILALTETDGAVGNIIRKGNWGQCLEVDDQQGIANSILQYYELFQKGKLANQITEESIAPYDVKFLADRLGHIFDKVSEN